MGERLTCPCHLSDRCWRGHGTQHRPWSELSQTELDEELSRLRQVLVGILGQEVDEASCPFGKCNPAVLRALREHGYRRVYTSDGGWVVRHRWSVPHRTITRDDTARSVASAGFGCRRAAAGPAGLQTLEGASGVIPPLFVGSSLSQSKRSLAAATGRAP